MNEATMCRLWMIDFINIVLFFAVGAPSCADDPRLSFGDAQPIPEMNALFQCKDGWIGADGAHSLQLSDGRRMWLFSDTWVGSVHDGKRFDATIVNNSVALQDGVGANVKLQFVVGQNRQKRPAALITPADGRGWFWLQAGAYNSSKLYLFLSHVEKTGRPGVFGFRQFGQTLGIVANPNEDPVTWRIEQRKLPWTIFNSERELTFGAAVLQDGEFLYVFGTDEDVEASGRKRYLILARTPVAGVADFTAWRFYGDGGRVADFRAAGRMVGDVASECSVSYLAEFRRYVLVYTEGGMSARIFARTAPAPWGPWSAATVLYRCPEASWDTKIFCYGAKAHASLSARDELVVSYIANSFDFWQVAADARIYWPRFVRVKLRNSTMPEDQSRNHKSTTTITNK
jgi:hypothetical protein